MENDEEQREDEIELFFDRQRPHVEQGDEVDRLREVVEPEPEADVRPHRRLREGVTGGPGIVQGNEQEPTGEQGEGGDHHRGRPNPADATIPKRDQREASAIQIGGNDRCDQVTGDHKKNIDADKPAREADAAVIENHGKHSESPQAVNVEPVFGVRHCVA